MPKLEARFEDMTDCISTAYKSKPNYEVTETNTFTFVIHSWGKHFTWDIVDVSEKSKEEAIVYSTSPWAAWQLSQPLR